MPKKVYNFTADQDKEIIGCFTPPIRREAIGELKQRWGTDYKSIRGRARQLRCKLGNRSTLWKSEEIKILTENPEITHGKMVDILASYGYQRSKKAIRDFRYKKLGWLHSIERDAEDVGYSLRNISELLGVKRPTVFRWITGGMLKPKNKQLHKEDMMRVTRESLRRFMLDNPVYWEPGKVDKYWLVDLMRG